MSRDILEVNMLVVDDRRIASRPLSSIIEGLDALMRRPRASETN